MQENYFKFSHAPEITRNFLFGSTFYLYVKTEFYLKINKFIHGSMVRLFTE